MSHSIANRLTMLGDHRATVIVVCECGDKFRAHSTRDAEREQFQHMLKKERGE